jgi:phosphate-selective porin OprO and OprP
MALQSVSFRTTIIKVTFCVVLISVFSSAFSQTDQKPQFQFKSGVGVTAPDSMFSINVRFRMQNRMGFTMADEDTTWSPSAIEFRTRRTRLRLDGWVFNPKWQYALQLSFSRGDQDWDNAGVPNVLRDAMMFYEPNKNLRIGFGQGKLPGNRQRVVSSGEQQFADRSIVNATFTVDRDFGLQMHYHLKTGPLHYFIRGALSSGEGRNEGVSKSEVSQNTGMCYTGRFEFLPLGLFDSKSDYYESDLAREPKPKISLAGGMSFNDDAIRTGGQLGKSLYSSRDISTYIFDGLFKWKGISFYTEFMKRIVTGGGSSITLSDDGAREYVYDGEGLLVQSGYLFKNNFEIAGRYAHTRPVGETIDLKDVVQDYTICFSKFIRNHRFKCQFDATLQRHLDPGSAELTGQNVQFRFQIEMGI